MQIQIDTREHLSEYSRITKQFDQFGIQHFRSKLFVGDYCSLDNPRVVIDRKLNLGELCTNVTQQHERFRAELLRAKENGFKIVILCEHGPDIKTLEDVWFWENPRRKRSPKAVNGKQLYKCLCTIKDRYNVDFVFCEKRQTGKRIVEVLEEWQSKVT